MRCYCDFRPRVVITPPSARKANAFSDFSDDTGVRCVAEPAPGRFYSYVLIIIITIIIILVSCPANEMSFVCVSRLASYETPAGPVLRVRIMYVKSAAKSNDQNVYVARVFTVADDADVTSRNNNMYCFPEVFSFRLGQSGSRPRCFYSPSELESRAP